MAEVVRPLKRPAGADSARLCGAWRLVSPLAEGILYYDASGAMSVQSAPRRARPRKGETPTPAEAHDALEGYVAYFGTYTIDEQARTVTHRQLATVQPGPLTDLVRAYELTADDRLILRPVGRIGEIVWQRIGGRRMSLGPDARRLLGGWRMVSALTNGQVNAARGRSPTGLIFYDATGWMSVQIQGDHPPVELAGEVATPEEAHAALSTYWAYFGRYTVDEQAGTVTHHRTGSVNPGWHRHPDFVRAYEFLGPDRVVLRPQAPARNGNELVWERLRP